MTLGPILTWIFTFLSLAGYSNTRAATISAIPSDSAEIELTLTVSVTPSPLPPMMRWMIQYGEDNVDIQRIFAETLINGQRYLYNEDLNLRLVPEPNLLFLLGLCCLLSTARRIR